MPFSLNDSSPDNRIGEKGKLEDIDTGETFKYRKIVFGPYRVELEKPFKGLKLKATDVFALRNEMEIIAVSSKFDSPEVIAKEINAETDKVLAEVDKDSRNDIN